MALGDLNGRARVNLRNPTAAGVCDFCGLVWQLDSLSFQWEWAGAGLINTGYLACRKCLSTPFEQNRVLILPPDPVPRANPRVDFQTTPPAPSVSPANQGFSQYVFGSPIIGDYPTSKAAVLAQIAQTSGIPLPGGIVDHSITITPANQTRSLFPANPSRSWIAIYNPAVPQAQVSTGAALWGVTTNLIIGPGECYFWATVQGFGTVWQGAMTAIGLTPGMPLLAWEA